MLDRQGADAERVLSDYPLNLFADESGICDPATSAIAITVGAIAQSATPAVPTGPATHDIRRPVAPAMHPSPFTRVGPGINGAIKPEFVADGDNVVLRTSWLSARQGPWHRCDVFEPHAASSTVQLRRGDKLCRTGGVAICCGCVGSLAPSGSAAILIQILCVPFLQALPACRPTIATLLADRVQDGVLRACGYGVPDIELAVKSADRRVTLIAESSLALDTVSVFLIPIPDEFVAAPGHWEDAFQSQDSGVRSTCATPSPRLSGSRNAFRLSTREITRRN